MQGTGRAGGSPEPAAGGHQARQRAGPPPVQLHSDGASALQTCKPVPKHSPPEPCLDKSEALLDGLRSIRASSHCSDISAAPDSLSALSLKFEVLAEGCGLLKQLSGLGPVGLPQEVPTP